MDLHKITRRQVFAAAAVVPAMSAAVQPRPKKKGGKPQVMAATGVLFTDPRVKPLSTSGQQQPGCTANFYLTKTLSAAPVYADGELTTPLTQPVVADSAGRFPAIYLNPSIIYRCILNTSTASLISDTDPIVPVSAAPVTTGILGATLYPMTAAEASAGVTPTNSCFPPLWVERYGADPTGATDSGVGFRAACAVALAAGGGKICATGALYNFMTWDPVSFLSTNNLALFCVPGNTETVFGGQFYTKLRMSNTARVGMYAGGKNRTHIIGMRAGQTGQYIHDVQFDYDGAVQLSPKDFCYFARTISGGCIFERCYAVQAPITNGIVDSSGNSGHRVIVRDCWFQDCGPNMKGNGGINGDLSYIYLEAPNSVAEGNLLFNTNPAVHNCGAIEMHCSRYYVRNNFISRCWPAMYLGVQDGVTASVGSVVESNYFGFCRGGLNLIDRHIGLKITKNYFEANVDGAKGGFGASFGDIFTPLDSRTGVNSAGTQTALSILDNTFDMTNYVQGTARSGNPSNSLNIGTLLGAQISHNRFIAATPNAITLSGSCGTRGSNGASGSTSDVSISENDFIGCTDASGTVGYINIFATSAAGWGAGSVMQDIYVRDNHLWRSRTLSLSGALCLLATGGGPFNPLFTNVRFESNDLVNINSAAGIFGAGASVIVNGQSPMQQAITADGLTVVTSGVTLARVAADAAHTGIIMQAGTVANQRCTVVNASRAADTLTMAAAGTSNVADGTSCVIAGVTQKTFYWDNAVNLWYHS